MIKLKKCYFCLPNIAFLGHIVGRNGIQPDPSKIEKVKNFPIPTDVSSLRSALGLFSYYRKFVKDFSRIAKPLNQLLKKDIPFEWAEKQQNAFDRLKDKLQTSPILRYPDFENLLLFIPMHLELALEQYSPRSMMKKKNMLLPMLVEV